MTLLPAVRGFKNMSSILRYIVLQKKRPIYPILPYILQVVYFVYLFAYMGGELSKRQGVLFDRWPFIAEHSDRL